ncbi:50S ribosomal protein L3 glutamine methyltransferase, partial [Pseudomonas savastanoi]
MGMATIAGHGFYGLQGSWGRGWLAVCLDGSTRIMETSMPIGYEECALFGTRLLPWLVLQQLVAFPRSLSMITSRLRTVRDHIRWAVSRFHEEDVFFGHGTDNAWDEARQLVLGALHLPWEIADSYLDCRLEVDEISELQRLIKRRINDRVPTPYLLGEAWFCGMSFIVDDRVLIPRSPIAELIEERFAPWLANEPARILDLCTGSGCIGIACAEVFPEAEVALADLSYDALEVANQNI